MNYNFIYEIQQKILEKTNYQYERQEIQSQFKRDLNLLKMLTKDIKERPGNIFSNDNGIHIYNLMAQTEKGNITVAAENSNDMYVYINGENKGVGFRDKESSFRGLTGHYETNEGMFILGSNVYTVPIGERRYGEGTPVKPMCDLKIHFYDTEAMSYIEEYRNKMSLSENDIEFYLNQIGIFPDEEMTINARTIEEAIELANKFYLDPINFINMMRMENAKENTEGMSIKH